jgi:hypothetical protein
MLLLLLLLQVAHLGTYSTAAAAAARFNEAARFKSE